jgi:hypothetical protein
MKCSTPRYASICKNPFFSVHLYPSPLIRSDKTLAINVYEKQPINTLKRNAFEFVTPYCLLGAAATASVACS